jgi:hypothetical protein
MHYTTQLGVVHLIISLQLSLMLVLIQKLKMILKELQLTLHVKNTQQLLP